MADSTVLHKSGIFHSMVPEVIDLGMMEYLEALELQREYVAKRCERSIADTLLVLEHFDVVTLGRTSGSESGLDLRYFEKNGIPVISTARGGKVTYHGPGQLLIYPVIDLKLKGWKVSTYIDNIEKAVTRGLNVMGVAAERRSGERGVWVADRKIAFIGVAVRRWVTYHGVSINLNNDVEPFSHMNPCGEERIRVVSAKEALGGKCDMSRAKEIFTREFAHVFSNE
ncbi:MAG: lipoyl(octanoyl) transferase LipB [Candidatus Omnitrophica bacterium]|nr:lipoyl(octanoyl) transferase LipB [Candidatus Omnitrophota bacterium]MDD5487362.1 lipoyl(octanoyl) transferase LipB [Candidatus Omnitrophota bacterium]